MLARAFDNLISTPLSLRPESTPVDTLRDDLFNARSVNGPSTRAEISTFISDNQVDILFLTESWLCQQGDEARCSDLWVTPSASFRTHPVVVAKQSFTVTLSPSV